MQPAGKAVKPGKAIRKADPAIKKPLQRDLGFSDQNARWLKLKRKQPEPEEEESASDDEPESAGEHHRSNSMHDILRLRE